MAERPEREYQERIPILGVITPAVGGRTRESVRMPGAGAQDQMRQGHPPGDRIRT